MKKIIYSITTAATIVGILLTQSIAPAFAQQSVGGQKLVNDVNRFQDQASNSADKQGASLQNIISRADKLITNRLASLNKLLTRLQNDTKLSSTEKTALTTEITTSIQGLTALKAKIDADTDPTIARADAKTIITNYYVYSTFEPKIRLLVTLNNLQTLTNNIQTLVPQIQNLINTYKSQGNDVTQLQAALADVSTQLTTINSTLTADITKVQNIPTNTQPAPGTFSQIRQDIAQVVRQDLAKIRADFAQMRPLFKQLILNKPHLTPTPSVSQPSGTEVTPTPTTATSPSPTQ